MTTIVKRITKGTILTVAELDANVANLNSTKLETTGGTLTGLPVLANQDVDIISPVYPTTKPSLNLDFTRGQLDPRITFVRNSTAAYYDGQTSALAEQNLLLQSQFVANWATINSTLTANSVIAPDGTTTAATLIPTAVSGLHGIVQSAGVIGNQYTYSVYGKSNGYTNLQLYADSSGNFNATFDLTAGTAASTGGATVSIVSMGSGWYRCIATFTQASNTRLNVQGFPTGATANNFGNIFTGDGTSGIYIWGAQLEQRSSVTAYTPTTTAAITNYIPVLMTAPAGVARFDHDPITGKSLGLLIEESRTNLLTYSSDFSNAAWAKAGSTIGVGVITPDGSISQKLTSNASTTVSNVYRGITPAAGGLTFFGYVKSDGICNWTQIIISGSGVNTGIARVWVNLITGAVGTIIGGWSSVAITSVGNGWFRVSCTTTVTATLGNYYFANATGNGIDSYTGDGYSGIYIWGAQLEAGSFATSYIPTVASTVTRAADQASITGANFSSWYNQSQGSLYCESDISSTDSKAKMLWALTNSSGSLSDFINIYEQSGSLNNQVYASGSNQGAFNVTGLIANTIYKVGVTFSNSGAIMSLNGGSPQSRATGLMPSNIVRLNIGLGWDNSSNFYTGHIKKLSYYPVALSSSNLVALTS